MSTPPIRPARTARLNRLDYALTALAFAAVVLALAALAVTENPAHNGSRTWGSPPKTHRVAAASYALPAAPGMSASGNIQLGMQYVSVSFRVGSKYAGTPHATIYNNGPHAVRVVTLSVNGMSDAGRYLRPGQSQTLARGWVTVAGATATARYAVVDQANGIPGRATLHLGGGFAPVRPTSIVANVQAAAGGLAADGDYGPLTNARLKYIRANWRALPGTVARVQAAYGVGADGIWGPRTEGAYELLRNSALNRY
jgi:hypothetical protein